MKKHIKRFLAACLFLTAVFLFPAQTGRAAELEQTGASEDSVTVRWELQEDALQYLVYVGTCSADSRLYAAVGSSVMTLEINGLSGGSSNYVRVDYEYMDDAGGIRTKRAGYMAAARTLPGAVRNVRQTGWYDQAQSCVVNWDKIDCADGYEYVVRDRKNRTAAVGKVKSNTGTARINRVAASEICTISVRAYVTIGGEEIYGGWSSSCCLFAQPQVETKFARDGRLRIRWRRIKGADGYDVYVSRKGTGGYEKVKSAGASGNSVVFARFQGEKISKETKYYIYVTAKKRTGGRIQKGGRYFYQNTENEAMGYFYEEDEKM